MNNPIHRICLIIMQKYSPFVLFCYPSFSFLLLLPPNNILKCLFLSGCFYFLYILSFYYFSIILYFFTVWGFFFCGRKTKYTEQNLYFLTDDFRLSTFHVSHFLVHINKLFPLSSSFSSWFPLRATFYQFLLFNRIDSMHYVSHEKISTNDEFNTWIMGNLPHSRTCLCCNFF